MNNSHKTDIGQTQTLHMMVYRLQRKYQQNNYYLGDRKCTKEHASNLSTSTARKLGTLADNECNETNIEWQLPWKMQPRKHGKWKM